MKPKIKWGLLAWAEEDYSKINEKLKSQAPAFKKKDEKLADWKHDKYVSKWDMEIDVYTSKKNMDVDFASLKDIEQKFLSKKAMDLD